jgi:hypothetical protein
MVPLNPNAEIEALVCDERSAASVARPPMAAT